MRLSSLSFRAFILVPVFHSQGMASHSHREDADYQYSRCRIVHRTIVSGWTRPVYMLYEDSVGIGSATVGDSAQRWR